MPQDIVQTIPSATGQYRADIIRRSTGSFQIEVLRWTEEWVPGHGKVGEFWEPVHQGVTLTDSLEHAVILARQKLLVWEPPSSAPGTSPEG
jgi:hypothetical protein